MLLITAGLTLAMNEPWLSQNFSNAWDASSWKQVDGGWIRENVSGVALVLVLGTAIIGSLFSSDAWNNVTFIAGEIKDPKRNIPRSLLLGTAIVTILYTLVNVAYLGLLPLLGNPEATDVIGQGIQFAGGGTDRVGTAAASRIFGNSSVFLMAALIMVSTFGCNNGLIMAGARVLYAMSKENLFFKKAGTLNRYEVPGYALVIQAIWASVLCLSGTYGDLLDYTTFASLLFYVITIAGIFILRKKEPQTPRPYKVIAYPLLPVVYILAALLICVILLITKPENTWSGLVIVALGIPVYYFMNRKLSDQRSDKATK
jgi:basic amino acid/polyamine antiporter, APA family